MTTGKKQTSTASRVMRQLWNGCKRWNVICVSAMGLWVAEGDFSFPAMLLPKCIRWNRFAAGHVLASGFIVADNFSVLPYSRAIAAVKATGCRDGLKTTTLCRCAFALGCRRKSLSSIRIACLYSGRGEHSKSLKTACVLTTRIPMVPRS